jgi:hypothetical protein
VLLAHEMEARYGDHRVCKWYMESHRVPGPRVASVESAAG